MSETERDTFELLIWGRREKLSMRVNRFRGRERASSTFAFDAEVFAPESRDLYALVGARAALLIQTSTAEKRAISGIVESVEQAATTERGRGHPFRIRVVPRLACLRLRKTSRIFQDLSVPEIVARVAGSVGVPITELLQGSYPRRAYCVQYRETDLGFIERLLAEEGISYWFEHATAEAVELTGPEDRLVLVDHARGVAAGDSPLTLSLRRGGTAVGSGELEVERFARRSSLRTQKVLIRDYDFRRPLLDVRAETSRDTEIDLDLTAYRHRGDFETVDVDAARADVELEQARVGAARASGVSRCRLLAAGTVFALEVEEGADLRDRYLVTSVRHEGVIPEIAGDSAPTYQNRFTCIPADLAARPRRGRRTLDNVLATAVVVGPRNEEIHVDAFGRIKVQFHWDLEGQNDDRSSIWIRLMQGWSGAGWGTQFIPRVGMEVFVSFLGGDQDCPVVIGCVPNATHPVPFPLPESKSRSGLRTRSYPGGEGFNELSFDDASGREQVYLHAQARYDEVVGTNHSSLIRGDESLQVNGTRNDHVGGDLEQRVRGDVHVEIDGNHLEVVARDRDERVGGMAITRVEGSERRTVRGAAELEYTGDLTTRVLGSVTTVVGRADRRRAWVTHAEGNATLSAGERLELSADKELVLSVGKSTIRLTAEQIEVLAGALHASGEGASMSIDKNGAALVSKDKAEVRLDKRMLVKTESASLALEKEVKIDGKKILLNSPNDATDAPPPQPEPPTRLTLTDEDSGAPLARQRFLVLQKGGAELSGRTDQDGKAELQLAEDGNIVFPDLKTPGDFDAKPFEPYVVRQGDYLGKLAFVHGFDEDKVWNDPKNADVKARRKDPNQLVAGDVLHFPRAVRASQPLSKGKTHDFKAKVPKTTARFVYEDEDGPWAELDYVIEGLGAEVKGKTDDKGAVTIEAPVYVREVRVSFPDKRMVFPVLIGDMDPIDEPSGQEQRLQHLGLLPPKGAIVSEQDAANRLSAALRQFQATHDLPATGVMDDATRSALEQAHGE
ncbi:MAG: type VI secretion system tip protein TssI/VgrG [Polyangiaceae bacterium]